MVANLAQRFAGMAVGHGTQRHIAVNLVEPLFGPRGRAALALIVDAIVSYTTIMLFFGSLSLVRAKSAASAPACSGTTASNIF